MEITTQLVKHLANLSRLKFSSDELENFKHEFEKTMQHVDELQNIDTTNVVENAHILDAKQELRADEVVLSLTQETVVIEAPEKSHGMFRIKKIVE